MEKFVKYLVFQNIATDKLEEVKDELLKLHIEKIEREYYIEYENECIKWANNCKVQTKKLKAVENRKSSEINALKKKYEQFIQLSILFTKPFESKIIRDIREHIEPIFDKEIKINMI